MFFLQSLHILSAKELVAVFPGDMLPVNSGIYSIVSIWNIINLLTATLSRCLKICKRRPRIFITSYLSHGLTYPDLSATLL